MKKILIAVVVVLALGGAAYGGIIWYQNSKEQDETSLSDTKAKRDAAPDLAGSPDGVWKVGDGSKAGYRIENELLRGATTTATGYTSDIAGEMTLADEGLTISAATFEIDVASIKSDGFACRDEAFNEVMESSDFPTAAFVLTEPVTLDAFPAEDAETKVTVAGDFTLHGVTKPVTFDATAIRGGSRIDVKADISITYTDYGIENPSNSAATIGDEGIIDVSIGFEKS